MNVAYKNSIALLLLTFSLNCLLANVNIGVPYSYNFNKKQYKAGAQNWDIAQAENGKMYFANNDGLLQFDGSNWSIYKVENQTIVRSVEIAKDGTIYVGAQGDFGCFKKLNNGKLKYTSLINEKLSEKLSLADIWDIEIINNAIYFRSNQKIVKCVNDSISVVYEANKINLLTKVNDQIYFTTEDGIYFLENDKAKKVSISDNLIDTEINGMFQFKEHLYINTLRKGLFKINNGKATKFKLNDKGLFNKVSFYSSIKLSQNLIAIGTSSKGVLIIDEAGKILYNINKASGLSTNNVLSLFVDADKNLWCGLNNGIDLIATNSNVNFVYPNINQELTGYTVCAFNNKLYLGTNGGAYSIPLKEYYNPVTESSFDIVENAGGQVWNISAFNNQLLLNHHAGTFIVKNNSAAKLENTNGVWKQVQVSENQLISGNYNGLQLYEKNNNWTLKKTFSEQFKESARIIQLQNDSIIWVTHPYRGAFKIIYNKEKENISSIKLYNSKNGFPSDIKIYVLNAFDKIVFATEKGIYVYDELNDAFKQEMKLSNLFDKDENVIRLKNDLNPNKIWYISNKSVGQIVKDKNGNLVKNVNSELSKFRSKLVSGFEDVFPIDENCTYFPVEGGFLKYNTANKRIGKTIDLVLQQVDLLNEDSTIAVFDNKVQKFETNQNSFSFKYFAPTFALEDPIQFQYQLQGLDDKWSDYSDATQADFSNLNPGQYTFKVRAKDETGIESPTKKFSFQVAKHWYQSITALLTFALLALLFLAALVFVPRAQYQKEKIEMASAHKLIEENLKLKEENLKAELNTLREQISPHFFFNNLNTLSSIIRTEEKGHSLDYLSKLSNVYRYMLSNEEKDLVTVNQELDFLTSYQHLLQKRFGDELKINVEVDKESETKKIPAMALQLLIENVVKHNIINKSSHVVVDICTKNGDLIVKNNVNKKNNTEGFGLGLANLSKRYKILAAKDILINANNKYFEVKLPLLT